VTLRQVAAIAVPPGTQPGFDHADVFVSAESSRMYVAHTGTVPTEEGAHTIGWDAARKELWAFAPRASAALVFAEAQ